MKAIPEWRCASLYHGKKIWQWARASAMAPKHSGEGGSVLQGLEVRLAEGVVIAGVGSAVGLGDPQVGEQQGDRLGLHAGAAVGVQGELARADALFGASRADELFGQGGGRARRDHPADHVAAEDIDDHVAVEVSPLGWPLELGDVPGPQLIGTGGQPFGLGVLGVTPHVASFAPFVLGGEDAVEGPHRARILALVE
jgi:hypothetical protein